MLRGSPPPPIGEWKLKAVATAVATTRDPETRQTKEVWKVLGTAILPRKVKDIVRQVLWKKLPVGKWMEGIGMRSTNKCPLCTRVADTPHKAVPVLKSPYTADQGPVPPNKIWAR